MPGAIPEPVYARDDSDEWMNQILVPVCNVGLPICLLYFYKSAGKGGSCPHQHFCPPPKKKIVPVLLTTYTVLTQSLTHSLFLFSIVFPMIRYATLSISYHLKPVSSCRNDFWCTSSFYCTSGMAIVGCK